MQVIGFILFILLFLLPNEIFFGLLLIVGLPLLVWNYFSRARIRKLEEKIKGGLASSEEEIKLQVLQRKSEENKAKVEVFRKEQKSKNKWWTHAILGIFASVITVFARIWIVTALFPRNRALNDFAYEGFFTILRVLDFQFSSYAASNTVFVVLILMFNPIGSGLIGGLLGAKYGRSRRIGKESFYAFLGGAIAGFISLIPIGQ